MVTRVLYTPQALKKHDPHLFEAAVTELHELDRLESGDLKYVCA